MEAVVQGLVQPKARTVDRAVGGAEIGTKVRVQVQRFLQEKGSGF